jgi:membrane dipeptidase
MPSRGSRRGKDNYIFTEERFERMNKPTDNHFWPAMDSHVDLIYDLLRHHPERTWNDLPDAWVTIPKMMEGGIRAFVSVYYTPDSYNGAGKAAGYLRNLMGYGEKYLTGLSCVRSAGELAAAFQGSGPPRALLLLENAEPLLEYPPEDLKERGFCAVGLTHVGRNRIACGNAVEDPEGLTSAGRELVVELHRLGFAIDTAHLSEPSFREVADLFPGLLFSSHTGFREFNNFPRNLSHGQIQTIISRQGIVGMAAAPGMISDDPKVGISHVFRQIDWFVQKYGVEGIGIGSDMGGYDGTCHGFNDHRDFPRLSAMMSDAGYPHEDIASIMGWNWFRFFSRLLSP